MNQSMERLFNTSGASGQSSPRLRQSSPLVKDSTATTGNNSNGGSGENKKQVSNRELISPPPATVSHINISYTINSECMGRILLSKLIFCTLIVLRLQTQKIISSNFPIFVTWG